MVDTISKEARSKIMSRIRSKNTAPELLFKKILCGLRLRYQPKGILGNPDFASKKHKVTVFIDGDFWHGYNWKKLGKAPPKGFWQAKISRNINRDIKYTKELKKDGWRVLRLWEHEVIKNSQRCFLKVREVINQKNFKQ